MAVISASLASAITQTVARQAAPLPPATNDNGFGEATNVTLSPAAQAVVAAPAPPTANASAPPPPAPATAAVPAAGAGQGAPIPVVSTNSEEENELAVQLATDQVVSEVGYSDASLVVDSSGNIDYPELYALINQQAAQQAAQQPVPQPPQQPTQQVVPVAA